MKRQVLTIDFKADQGVILGWNYSDLSRKPKFFRHLLVLSTSDTLKAQNFLENYIKLIKPGDLFATIYKNSNHQLRFKSWSEKTYSHNFIARKYINLEGLEAFRVEQAYGFIQSSLQQSSDPLVLNFFLQKADQIQDIRTQVQKWHQAGKMRFINSVFSPLKESSMSVSQGLNLLCANEAGLMEFYHQHINQIAVEYAHLEITCRNGQLNSCNQTDWHNTAFNKIERYYNAPSAKYTRDVLHIINSRILIVGSYELQVVLTFKTLAGATVRSEKKLVINFDHSQFYNRTVMIPKRKRVFVSSEDIQLEDSPYTSETLICFEKEINGNPIQEV